MAWPYIYDEYYERQKQKQQLAIKQGPAHTHALAILRNKGQQVSEVIRVNPESILFLDDQKQVKTAWLHRTPKELKLFVEAGMPALPPEEAFEN